MSTPNTNTMLSHDNLARHTLHHQELDHKRDFVQEYLESLNPSAAPEVDPELSTTTQRTMSAPVSSLKTKGSGGGNSKTSPHRHHQHHHHNHHSQDKDKKGKQPDHNVPSSPMNAGASTYIESAVPKQSSKKHVMSQLDKDNPTMNDYMKRKDVSKARLENTKHKKKRKKHADDVELNVEKLDINALYAVHHALQQEPDQPERTDTRTTALEKSKPTVSSRKRGRKNSVSCAMALFMFPAPWLALFMFIFTKSLSARNCDTDLSKGKFSPNSQQEQMPPRRSPRQTATRSTSERRKAG